jgi:hypothetical protein
MTRAALGGYPEGDGVSTPHARCQGAFSVERASVSTQIILANSGQGITRATHAKDGTWAVELALDSPDVTCLATSPEYPLTVYAGMRGAGVMRSDDAGRTWRSTGLVGRHVRALAVSRSVPGVIYAGTKPAFLFVSRDGGLTWDELAAFRRIRSRWLWFSPAEKPFSAYVQAIALSPSDPGVILAGIEAGAVVRSDDGGRTWAGHRRGALRDCHSLFTHPAHGEWAYEGGGTGAGVAVSRDAGATWSQPRAGLPIHYGWAVAADCARPEVWYASVSPGPMKAHSAANAQAAIYRATGGAGWQRLTGGLPQPLSSMPYALLADPHTTGHVYAGLGNGEVWHSEDYGDTWRALPLNLKAVRGMALLAL